MDRETQPGTVLAGRYTLIRVIGVGGFGRVWEAEDRELARSVAVKEVTLSLLPAEQQKERLDRALREGRNAAALADHPNIVSVYDVIVEDNKPWIIMQLVRGMSLRQRLLADPDDPASARSPLDTVTVTAIADGMLSALAALHAARILHRDVKPGNILLADDGRVLLTDFGIAKAETDSTVTVSGSVMGTMAYIAPERAEGEDDEPKSDLFSLGVTLFEAVEGESPFERSTKTGTLTAILTKPLPPMTNAGAQAPLIEALTLKRPDQRPTVAQAQALLKGDPGGGWTAPSPDDAATEEVPAQAKPGQAGPGKNPKMPWESVTLTAGAGLPRPPVVGTPQPSGPTAGAPRRTNRALIAGGAGVVAAAGIGLMLWTGRHHDQQSTPPPPAPTVTTSVVIRTTRTAPPPPVNTCQGVQWCTVAHFVRAASTVNAQCTHDSKCVMTATFRNVGKVSGSASVTFNVTAVDYGPVVGSCSTVIPDTPPNGTTIAGCTAYYSSSSQTMWTNTDISNP